MQHIELMKELNRILAYLFDDDKEKNKSLKPNHKSQTRVTNNNDKSKYSK